MTSPEANVTSHENWQVQEGSTVYYATLYTPPATRTPVRLLHALHDEIRRIPESVSDPGVARIKLEWWREEADRIQQRQARHPIGRQIEALPSKHNIDSHLVRQVIDATETHMETPILNDITDWLAYLDNGPAFPWICTAKICNTTGLELPEPVMESIRYSVWVDVLQTIYPHARKGRCIIPVKRLQEYRLTTHDIVQHTDSDKVREYLQHEYNQTISALQNSYRAIPLPMRKPLLPVLALNRLSYSLAKAIRRDGLPDPTIKHALTPLRRLAITWRVRLMIR